MDVVLEVFDQYLGDRVWAYLLPAFPLAQSVLLPSKSDLLQPNGTYSSMRQAATGVSSAYTYHPASQYMSFEPSDFAYMSQWDRNNIWRQAASLFTLTLYVSSLRILFEDTSTDIFVLTLLQTLRILPLLHRSYSRLLHRLRPRQLRAPKIHQKPSPPRDNTSHHSHPLHRYTYCSRLPPRSPRLLQNVRLLR